MKREIYFQKNNILIRANNSKNLGPSEIYLRYKFEKHKKPYDLDPSLIRYLKAILNCSPLKSVKI